MRHVFILNPLAGKHQKALEFAPLIRQYFEKRGGEHEIIVTKAPGDATRIAREQAERGDVRLYAVGGDGTLLEVVGGADGFPEAEITSVPCGSGNDYVKSYGEKAAFLDLPNLIEGEAVAADGIRCGDTVSLNICSMGLDADVADGMAAFKRLPLVSGSMAYKLSVFKTMLRPIGHKLSIKMDTIKGAVEREGKYLFALAAGGQYYGGGFRGAPSAVTDDGLLDFVLVKSLPRLKALPLLGGYKRGEHYGWSMCEHFRGTRMEVHCEAPSAVNIDGECHRATDTVFEILPARFRFVLPRGLTRRTTPAEEKATENV